MYEIFDRFLVVDTWHTRHPLDMKRFYQVLAKVVGNKDFSPEALREHMLEKLNISSDDTEHPFFETVQSYARDAWAVKEYLEANGL